MKTEEIINQLKVLHGILDRNEQFDQWDFQEVIDSAIIVLESNNTKQPTEEETRELCDTFCYKEFKDYCNSNSSMYVHKTDLLFAFVKYTKSQPPPLSKEINEVTQEFILKTSKDNNVDPKYLQQAAHQFNEYGEFLLSSLNINTNS